MDLGEPFKKAFRVDPGEEGTFVVTISHGSQFGFTTIDDLLIWMAKHGAKARVTDLGEGDVVNDSDTPFADMVNHIRKHGPQRLGGFDRPFDAEAGTIRRTTAAEIIREREDRNAALALAAEKHAAQRNAPVFGDLSEHGAKTLADRVQDLGHRPVA